MQFPDIYKDPNPKPEIAIALSDDFEACFGFLDKITMVKNLTDNAPQLVEAFDTEHPDFLKDFCFYIFKTLDLDKSLLSNTV